MLPLRSQSQPTNWREKPQALRPRKAHRLIFPLFANATENATRLSTNRSHLISMLALISRGVRLLCGLAPQQVQMNKQLCGFGCGNIIVPGTPHRCRKRPLFSLVGFVWSRVPSGQLDAAKHGERVPLSLFRNTSQRGLALTRRINPALRRPVASRAVCSAWFRGRLYYERDLLLSVEVGRLNP